METLQVIGQECGIASNVWANHGVTICVCVMFLLLTYSERFQNFRPHLSEEQRLRVALEVYNAALALDGGTKRFLHAFQDMRNRLTMAPCFWMGAGCSMLLKNKMSTVYSFDAALFLEVFYISLKRETRCPIECCRSSDWKQTFGPIASRHASRVDLAAELLYVAGSLGEQWRCTLYLSDLWQALGITTFFDPT